MLYDIKVLNHSGVWQTDTTTGSMTRAQERAKFLVPRVPAVQIDKSDGTRLFLDDPR